MKRCPFCRAEFESGAYCPKCATFVPDAATGPGPGWTPVEPAPGASPAGGDAIPGSQHLYAPGAPFGPGGSHAGQRPSAPPPNASSGPFGPGGPGWAPKGPGPEGAPSWDRFGPAGPHQRGAPADFGVGPAGGCRVCGGGPAMMVTFKQGIGMLLMRRTVTISGPFCRDCGQSQGRSTMSKTLITGWWGMISFFMNFAHIAHNIGALSNVGKLQPASGGEPARRLAPGTPVFLRPGFFVALALFAFIGFSLFSSATSPSTKGTTSSVGVGSCVKYGSGDSVAATPCSGPHDGKVISFQTNEANCPANSQSVIPRSNGVWCVDETQ